MIIDRDAISKNLFLGASKAARSLMPNSVSAYREDPCGPVCAFDPEGAKKKLEAAKFTGTIPLSYNAASTTDAATAQAISNEARKIGLKVQPTPIAAAAMGDTINKYQLTGPVIQLWGSSFPSASEWIASIGVDANYRLKYKNETYSKAVADAWAATSQQQADAAWQRAGDAVLADQVLQPLYYQVRYIAHAPCAVPVAAGGDQQIYRSKVTCTS